MIARSALWIFLLTLGACAPDLVAGAYACDPAQPDGCPPGWLCQRRGAGLDPRCYPTSGGYCGNAELDDREECDGTVFAEGATCATGFPYCRIDCQLACTLCGDGVLEATPAGPREECDDGNFVDGDGCSAVCTLSRCGDGFVDSTLFETCDLGAANSNSPNAACRKDCHLRRCGDGIVDTGEVCDDGNLDAGDRCTPDCKSDVRCGNGYVDFVAGELCDDGNLLSHDGCSSNCLTETPSWTKELPENDMISARGGHALAYDAARARLVLFGGRDSLPDTPRYYGDLHEWDGTRWRSSSAVGPTARYRHAMAYDAARKTVVLFGGISFAGDDRATWEWDGARWSRVATAENSPTSSGPMAADPIRQRVVLFTGDTWEWDGAQRVWRKIPAAAGGPAPDGAIVFDPVLGRVVLIGGGGGESATLWQWEGARWSELSTATTTRPPSGTTANQVSYDVKRQRIVLVRSPTEIWEWRSSAKTWERRTPVGPLPEDRSGYAIGYDGARGRILMIAGQGRMDLWEWNGTSWSPVAEPAPARPTEAGRLVYDALDGRSLSISSQASNGVWGWRDRIWTPLNPVGAAPVSSLDGVAYDQRRRRAMLVNGYSRAAWEWDGQAWRSITAIPVAAETARAVFDPIHRRTLVFGGFTAIPQVWAWDGATWTSLATFDGGRRIAAALTYDWVRDRLVMFGGFDGDRLRDETWEFSGLQWVRRMPGGGPPASDQGEMVFDPHRRRSLYQQGGKMWEWDGEAWTEVTAAGEGVSGEMSYNPLRAATLVSANNGEVWAFAYKHPAAREESCMSGFDVDGDRQIGCADPDCWPYCTPLCSPGQTCDPQAPRCGDGVCNAALENCRLCPGDCGTCAAACGDFLCDAPETNTTCPGDCR